MKLRLIDKKQEGGNAWSFHFSSDEAVDWIAGQYLHYTLPHDNPDQKGTKRYFTIASATSEQHIQLTTRLTGSTFKEALAKMDIGDEIQTDKPDGDFIWQDADRPYVFIAGGIGITPFRSILIDLHSRGRELPVRLLYGNRDDAYIFKEEIEKLASDHPELEINYMTAPTVDIAEVQSLAPELLKSLVYFSGPEPMVESVGDALRELGLPEEQLKQDFFEGYDEKNF